MSKFFPSGGTTYTLQSSISSTQTTITLTSFTVPVSGTLITMAVMNTDIAYMTIAPRTSQSEFISFTGITQNADGTATLTGVTRGLDKNYPYTSSSSFKLPHAGSTQVILSDAPQVFNQYSVIANDETITGRKVFPSSGGASSALVGVSYVAPIQDTEIASKKYVDTVAIYGAPLATTTVAGIVQLPTDAQREAGTDIGSTLAGLVLPNRQYGARNILGYGTAAGSPNTYTVTLVPAPTAYATGQVVGLVMPNQNTGSATININGLGAKTIRLGGTSLFAGAFTTSSVVGMQYNGTQFDIIYSSDLFAQAATIGKAVQRNSTGDVTVNTTPTASTDAASKAYVDSRAFKTGNTTHDMTSTTTTTIAHGLGATPKFATFHVGLTVSSVNSIADTAYSYGSYDGSTQNCNYTAGTTNGNTITASQDTTHAIHYGFGSTSATPDNDNLVGAVSWDATNITITWTKTGTPSGTGKIIWSANS